MKIRIKLTVHTVEDVLNRETAMRVLRVMREHGFVPERISPFEPVKPRFTDELFIEHWIGFGGPGSISGCKWDADFIGKGSPNYDSMTWIAYAARHSKRTLSFRLWTRPRAHPSSRKRANEQAFAEVTRFGHAMCVATRAVFGFVTPVIVRKTLVAAVEGDTNELDTLLPGLHWTTFVGAPWIDAVRGLTEGVAGLIREESGGILTLRLDASPLSDEVLSGELAGRIQTALKDRLFTPGALPPVSYEKLWAKAKSALTSPPEATNTGITSWSEIAAGFRGMPLSETIEALAEKGRELGKTLGMRLDFSERALARVSEWLPDAGRTGLPVSKAEVVGSLGAYCGETMRRNLGGEWAVNPKFPDFPALRGGENWAYPFGQVEQCLNRLSGLGFTPAGFYRAYKDMGYLLGQPVPVAGKRDDSPPPEIDQRPYEHEAEEFVKVAKERWGVALDYSKESLIALDLLADKVAGTTRGERKRLKELMEAYLGETLRRVAGGRWAVHKEFGLAVWMVTALSEKPSYVFPSAWVDKRVRNGMGDSIEFKGRVHLGWRRDEPSSGADNAGTQGQRERQAGFMERLRSLFGRSQR